MSKVWKRLAATLALGAAAQAAQAGVIWNGHEYELVSAPGISWTDAYAAVDGTGWYLATITSLAENDFVVASVLPESTGDRSHYWIGLNDVQAESSFAWVTGETFSYANWNSGEPNNTGNEDYVAYDSLVRSSWGWNDATDNLGMAYVKGYLKERVAVNSVPVPGALSLLGLGLGMLGLAVGRRRRG